jgi:hypothetical protein
MNEPKEFVAMTADQLDDLLTASFRDGMRVGRGVRLTLDAGAEIRDPYREPQPIPGTEPAEEKQ